MTTKLDRLLAAFHTVLAGIDHALVSDFVSRIRWNMDARPLGARRLACLRHLDRAAEIAPPFAKPLATLLAEERGRFRWGQTYAEADLGKPFVDNYGWLEVFGARGHFINDTFAGGILILGPNLLYPDHHHIAEEIYVPLTGGTCWRKEDKDFAIRQAGEVIYHASNVSHAMQTGSDPLLALYLWHGGPLDQKSSVTGTISSGKA